jgi:hypothetical protein
VTTSGSLSNSGSSPCATESRAPEPVRTTREATDPDGQGTTPSPSSTGSRTAVGGVGGWAECVGDRCGDDRFSLGRTHVDVTAAATAPARPTRLGAPVSSRGPAACSSVRARKRASRSSAIGRAPRTKGGRLTFRGLVPARRQERASHPQGSWRRSSWPPISIFWRLSGASEHRNGVLEPNSALPPRSTEPKVRGSNPLGRAT